MRGPDKYITKAGTVMLTVVKYRN